MICLKQIYNLRDPMENHQTNSQIDAEGDIEENLLGGFKVLILGGIAGKTTPGSGDDEIPG